MRVTGKVLTIGALMVVAIALVGMLVGFGHLATGWQPPPATAEVPRVALPAVVYRDMEGKARGPNRGYTSHLASLMGHVGEPTSAESLDPALRAAVVARRAARRAYNGAPPIIPHPVDPLDVTSCYACHGQGRVIGELIAPKISHERYTNCTQCHAPGDGVPGQVDGFAVANTFHGAPSAGRGQRAYAGAPPTIPHSTHMRQDCASCHGLLGQRGLRTSHPWRANCTQCHAPSAELDQARFTDPGPPPWAGETKAE